MGKLQPAAMFEEDVHSAARNFFQCQNFLLSKESEKNINISMIGLDSVVCQALLCDQVAKIKRSCRDELLREGARRGDQVMCRRGYQERG